MGHTLEAAFRRWLRGSRCAARSVVRSVEVTLAVASLGAGCGGGSEPALDGGPDSAGYVTCCIDNRYDQCPCYSENCDGPFIANCGGGVCANYYPMTPISDPCEGVP